jgi:Staphylococcal nuclease homologue
MLVFQKNPAFLVIIVSIFSGLLAPILSFDFASATSEEGGDDNSGDNGNGGGGDEAEPEPEPQPEPEPEPDPEPGLLPGPEPPDDPCEENPEAEGCTPEPPIDPCIEDPTAEGCEPEPPICKPCPTGQICPDVCEPLPPVCQENPSLPECGPVPPPPPGKDCHPSYPGRCIQPPPPDLDCRDISARNFKVVGSDPHRFDGDNDGIGCEGGGSGVGNGNNNGGGSSSSECQGQADCFRGMVTEIVDGDTLDINNVRVRLALVNTPERGEDGCAEAIDFVQSICGVGSTALVDEDDGQKEGSFDRVIGLVYCGNDNINNKKSLNGLLLEGGYATIYQEFCGISEFSTANWAQSRGC